MESEIAGRTDPKEKKRHHCVPLPCWGAVSYACLPRVEEAWVPLFRSTEKKQSRWTPEETLATYQRNRRTLLGTAGASFIQGTARRVVPSWIAPTFWDPRATGYSLTPPRIASDEARANASYTGARTAVSKRSRRPGQRAS